MPTEEQLQKRRERHRQYYLANKEKVAKRQQDYKRRKWQEYKAGSEDEKRAYLEKQGIYRRRWLEKNRERIREYHRGYQEKNREKIKAYSREWARRRSGKCLDLGKVSGEEVRRAALRENEIFAAASKAVPTGIKAWRREDIISDIVLAVLEGSLEISQIAARAKEFIAGYNRKFNEYMHAEFDEAFMQVEE